MSVHYKQSEFKIKFKCLIQLNLISLFMYQLYKRYKTCRVKISICTYIHREDTDEDYDPHEHRQLAKPTK